MRLHSVLFAATLLAGPSLVAALPAPSVTLSTVATNGYSANSINSVAINRNSLVTAGNYQFIAYYDANTVRLGRRSVGGSTWSVFDTGLAPVSIADDHDNVAIAVDGNGRLHLSWGMHNNAMRYRMSADSVLGATWGSGSIGLAAPSYWTGTAANNDSSVTYPEFYNVPNSKDLLFVYRQGASGDGDSYFARYDAETNTFAKNRVIAGSTTSVNAYLNRLAYDGAGALKMTWTWRDTPAFQSNHNILYAQSPDSGLTWTKQNGAAYTLPITEGQSQVIATIPQNSTLINQTDMAIDAAGNPVVATWYAPGAAQGDNTREYMLSYYDGAQWRTSQITNRPTETLQTDATVRDLGRPIVLIDDAGRTLVVMRYKDSASSANGGVPTSTANNNLVVAISSDKQTWEFLTLSTADMGVLEPTYDAALWARENRLSLFYQPLGGSVASSTVQVLDWNARAYFAALPEPTTLASVAGVLCVISSRRRH